MRKRAIFQYAYCAPLYCLCFENTLYRPEATLRRSALRKARMYWEVARPDVGGGYEKVGEEHQGGHEKDAFSKTTLHVSWRVHFYATVLLSQ